MNQRSDAMVNLVARLCGVARRAPGTDAERRAARALQDELIESGRDAELEPAWVRPEWALLHALHALLGIAASLVAVTVPAVGLGLAAAALASLTFDLVSAWPTPLRWLTPSRATQNVVSQARVERPVRLVLAAAYDAPRTGWAYRPSIRRAAAWLRHLTAGLSPGPFGWLALALLGVALAAGARLAGVDEAWLGVAQLVPTAGLLIAFVLALDIALSPAGPGANDPASGAAVAIALARELDAQPPRNLAVDVVLCGAGTAQALGMRAFVRARRAWPRNGTVIIDLAACGAGRPRWLERVGPLGGAAAHPRLLALARRVAAERPELEAQPASRPAPSGSWRALAAGFPALTIGCHAADGTVARARTPADTPDALDPASLDAALRFCLAFVAALDQSLDGARPAPRRPATRAGASAAGPRLRSRLRLARRPRAARRT